MRAWIGKSLLVIGSLHTAGGVVYFWDALRGIAADGLVDTIDITGLGRNAVFWFLFAGVTLLIIGGMIDWAERTGLGLPRFLKWSFLAITVIGCVIMPKSGFWLLIVPTVGLWVRGNKTG